jgi:predicted transcriptional regulator
MMTITITLPNELYEQLLATAERENRPVDEIAIAGIAREVGPSESSPVQLTREEEKRLIQEAMPGRIWTDEDVSQLFPWLDEHPMTEEEIDEILASLPILDPPLSQTIIQMRDEERY